MRRLFSARWNPRGPRVDIAAVAFVLLCAGTVSVTYTPVATQAWGGSAAGVTAGGLAGAHPLPADVPSCLTQTFEGTPECAGAQLVYDAADGYLLAEMICVNTSGAVAFHSCTWKYDGGSWSEVRSPKGVEPPPLLEDGFVWDAADGVVLLFGGLVYPSGHSFESTWTYKGGVWTNETTAPPFRLAPVQSVFDTSASEVLATYQVSGGSGTWNTYVYTYRAGTWTNVTSSSPVPADFPLQAQVADDPADHGVLYFGGLDVHPEVQGNSSWLFVDGGWRAVDVPENPPVLYDPTLAYDALDGYDLLVGGTLKSCVANPCLFSHAVWEFSGGAWKNTTSNTEGAVPLEAGGQMATDVALSAVIEGFGWTGYTGSGVNAFATPQSNLYSYAAGTWTEVPNPPATPAVPLSLAAVLPSLVAGAAVAVAVFYRSRARARNPPAP